MGLLVYAKRFFLILSYSLWTYFSSSYVTHIQNSVQAVCSEAGCSGVVNLLFSPFVSYFDRITLFTFGLPGIFHVFLVDLYGIHLSNISNSFMWFLVLLSLSYALYVIPAALIISILTQFVRLTFRKRYPFDKQFSIKIGIVAGAMVIALLNYIFISSNRVAYTHIFLDPSSILRDNIRKQHIHRLKNGFESYMLIHDELPIEIDTNKQFISSYELDFCEELVLEIGAVPIDPSLVVEDDMRGYIYKCPDDYDTGFQIQKINEYEYEITAPYAENEIIKIRI